LERITTKHVESNIQEVLQTIIHCFDAHKPLPDIIADLIILECDPLDDDSHELANELRDRIRRHETEARILYHLGKKKFPAHFILLNLCFKEDFKNLSPKSILNRLRVPIIKERQGFLVHGVRTIHLDSNEFSRALSKRMEKDNMELSDGSSTREHPYSYGCYQRI
jgi:hypothetical protein